MHGDGSLQTRKGILTERGDVPVCDPAGADLSSGDGRAVQKRLNSGPSALGWVQGHSGG